MKKAAFLFGVITLVVGWTRLSEAEAIVYPAPAGAPLLEQFVVTVDGKPAPVYAGSPNRFYGFCQFDVVGPVQVEVKTTLKLSSPRLIPERLGIRPVTEDNAVRFNLPGPCQVTLLPDGSTPENALHLFANPLEQSRPQAGESGVIYFGPGIHKTDVTLEDNQQLYLAGGAILKGAVTVLGNNAKIAGRGIIDGSDWGHFERREVPIRIRGSGTTVEGVIVRLSWRAGISIIRASDTRIVNTKICASRFANDDGITVTNADNVVVTDCFIRTDDDCIALKGYTADRRDVFACLFERCQLWCDRARIILVGHETMVHHMRDIVFRDIDVLKYSMTPFLIEPGELGSAGPNISFENIRLEGWGNSTSALIQVQPTVNRWMQLKEPGFVEGVRFRNITLVGKHNGPWVLIRGYNEKHTTKDVVLQGIFINGHPLKRNSPGVTVGPYATGIPFVDPAD